MNVGLLKLFTERATHLPKNSSKLYRDKKKLPVFHNGKKEVDFYYKKIKTVSP